MFMENKVYLQYG